MTRDDMSGSWLTGMTAGKSFRTPASRGRAQWKSRVVHWAWSGVARADTGMRSIGFEVWIALSRPDPEVRAVLGAPSGVLSGAI
jgi:hypothetical protein